MKEKDLQKYMQQETWFHGTTLSGWYDLCKYGVLSDFNKGNESDFGCGFYLAPKYKQAESYILRYIPYLDQIPKELRKPVVIEFELCLENMMNLLISFLKTG